MSILSTTNKLIALLPKDAVKIKHAYFSNSDTYPKPLYQGVYYGVLKKDIFIPSLTFLENVADDLGAITVSHKVAWLFTCNKNILKESILKKEGTDPFIVKNPEGVIIGIATETNKEYKNYWDVGDYLRRELHT